MAAGFNPLISGADRATRGQYMTRPNYNGPRFNPLISGADRATTAILKMPGLTRIRFNPLISGADRAT